MALEMGASTLAVLGATYVVPWLWNPIKSMIGQGVKRIKSIIDQDVKRVKDDLQYVKVYLKNLTRIAMEIGGSTLAVFKDKYAVPWMWNPTKPIIGQGVKRIKSMIGQGVKRIKSIIGQALKRVKNDLQYVKDCWYNARPIPGVADYVESDDEYNRLASDVVPAVDRDPLEDRDPPEASGSSEDRNLPGNRGPPEASGPSEDRNIPRNRDPSEASDPSEDRNFPEDSDFPEASDPPEASGPSEDRYLPEARGGPYESRNPSEDRDPTSDGASTSQYQVPHNANGRRRTILFIKKGDRCYEVFSYNTVTNKYERKSSSPKKPRAGVPGLESKIAQFLN